MTDLKLHLFIRLKLMSPLCFILFFVFTSCNSNNTTANKSGTDTIETASGIRSDTGTQDEEAAADEDPVIATIRREYRRIQAAALMKKEVEYKANPGGEAAAVGVAGRVTWFYDGDELVKILDEGSEDHGEWKEEYYFEDGKLFFIYNNNAYGGAMNPTENKYQTRLYINDGKIYRQLTTRSFALDDGEKKRLLQRAQRLYNARTAKDVADMYNH